MSDRSCCECSFEAEADTFFDDLLTIFIRGGTFAVIACTTSYHFNKIDQHDDEIEKLYSRLEKYEKKHESSQDHELKK